MLTKFFDYLDRFYDRMKIPFFIFDFCFYGYVVVCLGMHNPDMNSIDCNQGTDSFACGIGR